MTVCSSQQTRVVSALTKDAVGLFDGGDSSPIQVAGNDVLRDEGLAYAASLDAAGVDVTTVRYENLIHDYGLLNAISQVPAVRDALHQVAETLKKHV
jgi:acetyl esterase/lipase